MTRRLATVALASGLLLPLACGGGDDPVSDAATAELGPRVAEVRQLASDGRPEEALVRAVELQALVEDLHGRGELTDAGREAIVEETEAVVAELQLVITTTTTSTTTTAPPAPPRGDRDDEEEGGGNGNGNGNGHGRDRDD